MSSVAVQFGSDRHLVGVLRLPESPQRGRTAVILMNAGVIHRVGPHRFNVKLADHLASLGFPVMRMDLSGLGDSGMPSRSLPYESQVVADLSQAMDYLGPATGADRFVLIGICSGAENAFAAARADRRVAGAWMMDQFYFPTAATPLHYWRRRLEEEGVWPFLRRRTPRVPAWVRSRLARLSPQRDPPKEAGLFSDGIDPAEFARGLSELVARGVRTCFIYSGSRLDLYSYEAQLIERFGKEVTMDGVQVELISTVDHTLSTLAGQTIVVKQVAYFCMDVRRRAGAADVMTSQPST